MGEMNDFRYHPLRITAIVTLLGIGAIVTAALERAWWELTLIAVLTLYNLAAGYLEAARDYWRDRARTAERLAEDTIRRAEEGELHLALRSLLRHERPQP